MAVHANKRATAARYQPVLRGLEVQPIRSLITRTQRRSRPFYGWAVVAAAALVTFSSGPGQSYVFSVFVDPILAETGFTRTLLSLLYTVGTGVSAAMTVVASRLVDRYGPRLMLAAIAFALGIACVGMSLAHGWLAFLLGFAALRALGQGSLPVTATLLTAQWFVRYRGRAMSLVALGFAASNAVLPPVVRWLIETLGWRSAYVALGVMVWALLIPVTLLVVRDEPEALGLHPDGLPPAQPQSSSAAVGEEAQVAQRRILRSRDFWKLAIPLAAAPFVITALVFHQISIFGERGISPSVAAGVFAASAVASATMTTLAGFLVDRLGPKRLLLLNLGVLLLAIVQLQLTTSPLSAVIYAMTIGCVSGMQGVTAGVTWAHYYGRRGLGKIQGAASMVMISGAALAPLPLAALHQLWGSYALGLAVLMAVPLGCMVLVARFREPTPHT